MLSHEQEMEALRKKHLMLENAYNELKRKHARLNKRYTALCVKLCRQEDYMQAASTEDNKYVVRNYRQYTQYQIPQTFKSRTHTKSSPLDHVSHSVNYNI